MSSDARIREVERDFDGLVLTGVAILFEGLDGHSTLTLVLGLVLLIAAAVRTIIATDRAARGLDD